MEPVAMEGMSMFEMFQLLVFSDVVGITIGLVSIILLVKASRVLGGRIQKAVSFLIAGLVAMALSFTVTIGIVLTGSMTPTSMAFHHIIMVVGMILFVLAGKAFISFTKIS